MKKQEYKNKDLENSGAGVLFICPSTNRMLLTLRSERVKEPLKWAGFGGKIDPEDESAASAARREVEEEAGFNGKYKMFPLAKTIKKNSDGFAYYNFIGIVEEEFEPILNWENLDAKWFTLEEVDLLEDDIHPELLIVLKSKYQIVKNLIFNNTK